MTLPIRISLEAEAEATEAANWYERQRVGLGANFLASVDRAFSRIQEHSGIGSPVPGVDDEEIRRVFIRRFPYHVVYLVFPDRIQVLAVAHDRRRPGYWIGRPSS